MGQRQCTICVNCPRGKVSFYAIEKVYDSGRVVEFTTPISGRVDRASATETVDSGSIPGWVIPKTIKIGIHSFPA